MRTTFYLSPHPQGGWLAKQDGSEHYLIVSYNKQEVLDYLMDLCEDKRPCTIVIQSRNGDCIEERTLGTKHSM